MLVPIFRSLPATGAIGSSVQSPLAYTRGSDWVREAKNFRALSVSAGWRHVGTASPNISIITSDGGYRFERPVATC